LRLAVGGPVTVDLRLDRSDGLADETAAEPTPAERTAAVLAERRKRGDRSCDRLTHRGNLTTCFRMHGAVAPIREHGSLDGIPAAPSACAPICATAAACSAA
jgi:hypothetical protein